MLRIQIYSTAPSLQTGLPLKAERMRLLQVVQAEVTSIISEQCIAQKIKSQLPVPEIAIHAPEDFVPMYRGECKHFHGPYRVIKAEGKETYVKYIRTVANFNYTQAIPKVTLTGKG